LPIKTTNEQSANFEETDFGKKPTKPTKPRQFYKLNLPETWLQKDKPILRTYTTDQEQSNSHETQPIKTTADRNASENPEADFSDSTKPTRNFADERKFVEQKMRN
jgi:hypothetical protein